MRREHLHYLVCPSCASDLICSAVTKGDETTVQEGELSCSHCTGRFPIVLGIPRFVPRDNYASGFGFQWLRYARTQYDSHSGLPISEERFFKETRWGRDLDGRLMLEVGCGSGRFTEQACKTGAMVISVDYSVAVEANAASNGHHPNLLIAQADIYALPVRKESIDNVLCIGVLQHTPDVKRSFFALVAMLKRGASLVVDVYRKPKRWFYTKYLVRPFTRRIPPRVLYPLVNAYVRTMWPLARLLSKRSFGRNLNWWLLIPDYRGSYALTEEQLKEWAILDAFDMLAPAYDFPQTLETFRAWFEEAGLTNIDVHYGYNGIEGRGNRPR